MGKVTISRSQALDLLLLGSFELAGAVAAGKDPAGRQLTRVGSRFGPQGRERPGLAVSEDDLARQGQRRGYFY
jgi:hypothetical protein